MPEGTSVSKKNGWSTLSPPFFGSKFPSEIHPLNDPRLAQRHGGGLSFVGRLLRGGAQGGGLEKSGEVEFMVLAINVARNAESMDLFLS